MIEQLRSNPHHPFHSFASTTDAAREAAALAEATTLALLTQHRGRVISFSWEVVPLDPNRRIYTPVLSSIRLVMEGEGEDLLLKSVCTVSDLESEDWEHAFFAGDPFCEILQDYEEQHDCSPHDASVAVLARITGIEPGHVEAFFLAMDYFISKHFRDGPATVPLTTTPRS